MELISIIIPARNAEKFVGDCLQSITEQTYSVWEVIFVNDHSTDYTSQMAKEWSVRDSRIKVLENSGKGIISALQSGFSKSKGDYITRMDADDLMPIDKLELMFRQISEAPSGSVITGLVKYLENEHLEEGFRKYADWLNQLTVKSSNFKQIYKECVIASPNWMVSRNDFLKCGGFDALVYPEDYHLCFRFYENNMNVIGIPEITHLWRDHPARASRNDPNYLDQLFFNLKWHNFLQIDRVEEMELVLWGAGKKAKKLAQLMIDTKSGFTWVCNNPKKIGKDIFGVKIIDCDELLNLNNSQIIIAISSPDEQKEVRDRLKMKSLKLNYNYFIFC